MIHHTAYSDLLCYLCHYLIKDKTPDNSRFHETEALSELNRTNARNSYSSSFPQLDLATLVPFNDRGESKRINKVGEYHWQRVEPMTNISDELWAN